MDTQQQKTLFGILSYLGPFVIISWAMVKHDSFVKFHIKQGLVLLVIEVIVWVLASMFWPLWMLFNLIDLCIFVLVILGIINVVNRKEDELPVVGSFAKHFKI